MEKDPGRVREARQVSQKSGFLFGITDSDDELFQSIFHLSTVISGIHVSIYAFIYMRVTIPVLLCKR